MLIKVVGQNLPSLLEKTPPNLLYHNNIDNALSFIFYNSNQKGKQILFLIKKKCLNSFYCKGYSLGHTSQNL